MQTHITKTPSNYAQALEHKPSNRDRKQPASEEHLWLQKTDLCTVTSFKFCLNFQSNPFSRRMWGEIPFLFFARSKMSDGIENSLLSLPVCLSYSGLNASWGAAVNCLALIRHWFSIEVWLASIVSLIQLWCGHVALFSSDLIQSVPGGHAVWPPPPSLYPTHTHYEKSFPVTHTSSHSHTS